MRKLFCGLLLLIFSAPILFAQKDSAKAKESSSTHLQLLEAKRKQSKKTDGQTTALKTAYSNTDAGGIHFVYPFPYFTSTVTIPSGTIPPGISNYRLGFDGCVNSYITYDNYYFWQKSTDNGNTWSDILGPAPNYNLVTGLAYQPPALTQSTIYRRAVYSLGYSWGCPFEIGYSTLVYINVVPALSGGTISASNATISQNSTSILKNTISAAGGISPLLYQWQQKNTAGTFIDITNATTDSYTTPPLSASTTYRRKVTDANNNIAYSNEIKITVLVDVNGGAIGFYSGNPTQYSATPPLSYYLDTISVVSGTMPPLISNFNWAFDFCLQQGISPGYDWNHNGGADFFYSWEKSIDGGITWITVANYGSTYQPLVITQNTLYRRLVHTASEPDEGCGVKWGKSNIVSVLVTTPSQLLAGGKISTNSTSICPNSSTTFFNATAASGGTAPLSYQWEGKNTGGVFTSILNATNAAYTTPILSASTTYRRKVTDANNNIAYSNEITVSPFIPTPLKAGLIDAVQVICTSTSPGTIENIINACGGLGSLQYTWETSSNGNNWTAITNSDAPTYNAAAISTTTKYRRKVSDACSNTAYSNEVETLVYPILEAGTITPITQTVCSNTQIPEVIGLMQNCHYTNDYSVNYQWQIAGSLNGPWTDISSSTQAAYQPGLTSTVTYYRLKVSSTVCNAIAYSNVTTVDIKLCTVTSNSGSRTTNNPFPNTTMQIHAKQIVQGAVITAVLDNNFPTSANYNAVLQNNSNKEYVCTVTSVGNADKKIQLQIKLPAIIAKGNYTIRVSNSQKTWSHKIVID